MEQNKQEKSKEKENMTDNAKKSKKMSNILVIVGIMLAAVATVSYITGGILIFLHLK